MSVRTDPRWGHVRGIPVGFVRGHRSGNRGYSVEQWHPNPSGMCLCGCGGRTPVATRNNWRVGHRKGEHVLYLPGHNPGGLRGYGTLYFVGAGEGPIKVGWTRDVRHRLRALRTAHWVELTVYGEVPCPATFEREAHERLEAARVRGEWFEREPALALLAEMQAESP